MLARISISQNLLKRSIYCVFSFICFLFMMLSAQETGFLRNVFGNISIVAVMVILSCFRDNMWKIRKNWIILAALLIGCAVYFQVKNIHPSTYGASYYKEVVADALIKIFSVVFLIDSWSYRHELAEKYKTNLLFYVTVVAFGITLFMDKTVLVPIIIPTTLFLLTPIEKEEWTHLCDCVAKAYYVLFCVIMTYSLIFFPDVRYEQRYLGVFKNIEPGASFIVVAFLAVVYLVFRNKEKGGSKKGMLLLGVLALYPLYASVKVGSRAVLLGMLFVSFFTFLYLIGKNGKQRLIIGSSLVLFFGIVVVIILMLAKRDFENGNYVLNANGFVVTSSHFWDRIVGLYSDIETNYHRFESPVLNQLNYLSSNRIRIWADYVKELQLLGREDIDPPTHNFFLYWLVRYGFIGGVPLILWFLCLAVKCFMGFKKAPGFYIMPTIVIIYLFGFWNLSANTWIYPILNSMLLIFFMYPVYSKDEKKQITESPS